MDTGQKPDNGKGVFFNRDVIVILIVSLVARLIYAVVLPYRSTDSYNWEYLAGLLLAGKNPYQVETILSWPPFWLQIMYVMLKISIWLSVPFFRVLQCTLILVESAVIVLLARLIREIVPGARVRNLLILGMALNPAAILLVCQHCNFDVLVALWLLLFMLSLLQYSRSGNEIDWLRACLFLGLGVLTKTFPLVLFPFLAGGFRRASAPARFLGLAFLLGPVTLGMSIIYVLSPREVTAVVLKYRSTAGNFGVSGLLHIAGIDWATPFYNSAFYICLALVMATVAFLFWTRRSIGDRETVLLATLILMAVPALGPGYGPQYLYWYLPFLVATYAFYDRSWRVPLMAFAVVLIVTFMVEYAILSSDGEYFVNILVSLRVDPHPWVPFAHWVIKCNTETGQTLLRLPLFIAYLAILWVGSRLLLSRLNEKQTS